MATKGIGVKDLPARIRALREKAGLSRKELAALLYVTERAVVSWEVTSDGRRNMPRGLWELLQIKLKAR